MTTIINTYHVGYPDIDNTGASFLAVLVGNGERLRVYSGIVRLPAASDISYTAARDEAARRIERLGSHERYRRAVTFFPTIPEDRYDA